MYSDTIRRKRPYDEFQYQWLKVTPMYKYSSKRYLKIVRYLSYPISLRSYNLIAIVECNGWLCYNVAVEVGARGLVADSLRNAASLIGIRRRALKKLVRDVGREAAHCSKWIYWLSGREEWEYREVKGGA